MLHNNQPSADPIMLAALCAAVSLMVGFLSGMYWAMQPTVMPNAGMAGYEAQVRRGNVLLTVGLGGESERLAVEFAASENGRQGLAKLATQLSKPDPASPASAASSEPSKSKRLVQAPKREPLEIHAARSAPPPPSFSSPFGAFQSLFR